MATPKVPDDQKLFERVCYILKLKVAKFQLPTLDGFWAVLKNTAGGEGEICPPKIGLKLLYQKNSEISFRSVLAQVSPCYNSNGQPHLLW